MALETMVEDYFPKGDAKSFKNILHNPM